MRESLSLSLNVSLAVALLGLAVSPGASAAGLPSLVPVPDAMSGHNPLPRRLPLEPARVTRGVGLRHEYSRHDPFNADGSLVLLLKFHEGAFHVYRAGSPPYDSPANHVRQVEGLEEPRWDPREPEALWGLRAFALVRLDVRTGAERVVKDFARDGRVAPLLKREPDLYRVTTKDEGEPSMDLRYWALALQGSADDYRLRYLLCWDRSEDRLLGLRPFGKAEVDVDWVGMSPLGTFVLVGGMETTGGAFAGLTMADRSLSRFHRLAYATAHADVGLDARGREVVVMQEVRTDEVDMLPLAWTTKPVMEAGQPAAGTGRTPLLRLFYDSEDPRGLQGGVHVSCNAPGWCVVSATNEPGQPERNWLDHRVVLVSLDPERPRAWYLATVDGQRGEYWEETQAALSRDGKRVVWATNGGRDVGAERVWLMELRLPDLARAKLER